MANYIKIRDLSSYSTNPGGAVTGIYTGDYMALASRLPGNGGLESVQNTRRATIADTIRLYNEAQTIADAVAAAPPGTTPDQAADELAGGGQLATPPVEVFWDTDANDGAGGCRITNDPSLTARTFGSLIELGQGLSYTYVEGPNVPGTPGGESCTEKTYTLGLTPTTDVTATTFILFIGRNEYLDDASNYGAGVLTNWQASDNALTNVVESSLPEVQATGNYLLYASGNLNSPGWMRTSFQGATWSGNPLASSRPVHDAELSTRALIDTTQVLESGVMDISAGVNEVTTLNKVLEQIYGYGGYASAKCVANPFISLDSANTYAQLNFDKATSTIIFWIRGDGPQGNMASTADRAAIHGTPVGRSAFLCRNHYIVSPVAGKPRKINYDFGPKTSTNVTLPYNPVANRTLVWQWHSANVYTCLTNVHFKMYGLGISQDITQIAFYLFRYAGESTTRWDNSILDWSDSSMQRPSTSMNAVCNQVHQLYNEATVNFSSQFFNYSSGMRAAQDSLNAISDYDDYSRLRPSIEYMTNSKVNMGNFIASDGASLQRNFTFRPNNYSFGGLANRSSNTIHAWQRFRDGTAGVNEGFYFQEWDVLYGTVHQLLATPYMGNSSTYVDKSLITYGHNNQGNTKLSLGDSSMWDATVPFKPTAALGFGNLTHTASHMTATNGCTGYGVGAVMITGSTRPFNYLDIHNYNGCNSCLRQSSDLTTTLGPDSTVLYPPTAMVANGVDGWVGRITGGFTSFLLNGYGAVPGTSDGSGPLDRLAGVDLLRIDTVSPVHRNWNVFSGMGWMDNTTIKYIDDPVPYYSTHTDVNGSTM